MLLMLIAGVGLIAACFTLIARAVALSRLRTLDQVHQIGAYGFHPDLADPTTSRPLTGGLNTVALGLGTWVGDRVATGSESGRKQELMSAGLYRVSPAALIGYRVLLAIALAVAFAWIGGAARLDAALLVVGTPLMALIGWTLPLTLVRRRARTRLAKIDYELPELVDLLVVTVESGMGFAGSMQIAAERFSGPLGDELRLAMQEQAMGLATDESLANMLERSETEGMRSFVRSIRQGESLGVSIGLIMRNLAEEMRKRRRAHAEERAQKAPIKILFPLVGLIFPAIYVILLVPALLSFTATFGGGS